MTGVNGGVVWEAKYSSFGEAEVEAVSTGTNNLRFPGQYFDQETGLHYNRLRYYDYQIGRYLRSDPLKFIEAIDLYTYVANNPLIFADPLGLELIQVNLPGLGNAYLDDSVSKIVNDWVSNINNDKECCVNVKFTQAFRTTEYQKSLSKSKTAITPAKGGTSLHEAGYAVDISWMSIPEKYQDCVVKHAKAAGLAWGGNFSPTDNVHFYKEVPGGRGNRAKYIKQAQEEYTRLTRPK